MVTHAVPIRPERSPEQTQEAHDHGEAGRMPCQRRRAIQTYRTVCKSFTRAHLLLLPKQEEVLGVGGSESYKAAHTKPTQQQWSDQRMTKVSGSPGNMCLAQPPRKHVAQTCCLPLGLTTWPVQGPAAERLLLPDPSSQTSVELDLTVPLSFFLNPMCWQGRS